MAVVRESTAPLRKVEMMQFGLLSPEEIKGMAVCEVKALEMMEHGVPKKDSLLDPLMGPVNRDTRCSTCSGTNAECPGHFGYMELAKPVYHVSLIDKIIQVLRCVCFKCSRLRVPREHSKMKELYTLFADRPRVLLQQCAKLCATIKQCGQRQPDNQPTELLTADGLPADVLPGNVVKYGCGEHIARVRRNPEAGHYLELLEVSAENVDQKAVLPASRVLEIFRGISNEDCIALGLDPKFSRPEWMVLTRLPVPPLAVRPSVEMNETQSSHDDLTYQLSEILKTNDAIRQAERNGSAPNVIKENADLLQWKVATLFDNSLPRMPQSMQKSGRPIKAIAQRLKGKEGRVRGNLMGKRVDFSARTVITPDPNLSIDQVGVPRTVANNLTFPERVTHFNLQRMQDLVARGNDYPGAKYVIRDDGQRIDLRHNKKLSEMHLQVGYVVERHVVDDDVVVFNRQPTLHKMSMMGHRIKVLPWSTFRLNLSVTTPYNADFDGDEMNLHVPQSHLSRAEVIENMMVHKNIMTPAANRPVMGIVQDTLCAVRKMTRRDTFVEKADLMKLLLFLPTWNGLLPPPAISKPKELWTGKQIFSLIVPRGINVTREHSAHDSKKEEESDSKSNTLFDTQVLIEDGQLITGIICKKSLGNSAGTLIHVITMEHGTEIARQFFGNVQTVVNNWLLLEGQSIGVKDTIADPVTNRQVRERLEEAIRKVEEIVSEARQDKLKPTPGNTLRQTFEGKLNEVLNKARSDTGADAEKSLSEFNNFKAMTVAGSKGSNLNISQVIACVGQQNVEGKRVPFGFQYRTLPHFVKDDYGPESRGFVFNSYLAGLTPEEFFFHAMGGREGLIDTAVKTATTGYSQRRLIKAMESLTLNYDGTVRNSNGDLVQLLYGEDGMDGTAVENQKLPTLKASNRDFRAKFCLDPDQDKDLLARYLDESVSSEVLSDPLAIQRLTEEFAELQLDRDELRRIQDRGDDGVVMPINLSRLIWNAQKAFKTKLVPRSNLSPVDVVDRVRDLIKKLVVVPGNDPLSVSAQSNATLFLSAMLKSVLSAKRMLVEHRLTQEAFSWLLGEIEQRFMMARAHPGEMVGALAAECLGEPLTQMTLNTFHLAGVSSKNVTLGVPRLLEIISVSKSPRTPSVIIFLTGEAAASQGEAEKIMYEIELCTLRQLTDTSSIFYEPDHSNSVIEEDREFVGEYYTSESIPAERLKNFSPWVLRLELNRALVDAKKLSTSAIQAKLTELMGEVMVVYNDDNATVPVLRICVDATDHEEVVGSDMGFDMLRNIEQYLMKQPLKGLKDISKVYMSFPDKDTPEKLRVQLDEKGEFQNVREWVLETDGSALRKILSIEHVDTMRTVSNDIVEVCSLFGIEAARKAVENESMMVIRTGGAGTINYRHIALMCDIMTTRGYLMAISRHGVNRQKIGALMRCSFEETVDVLMEASTFAEKDPLKGVSENIMLGNLVPAGTGFFDLFLNEPMLEQALSVEPELRNDPVFDSRPLSDTPKHGMTSTDWNQFYSSSFTPGGATPSSLAFSPDTNTSMSPHWAASPGSFDSRSPFMAQSPHMSAQSPRYSMASPGHHGGASYNPSSPGYNPSNDYGGASPSSPKYSATSPHYSATSPKYSPTSPGYSPTSPKYSPTSPKYSPTSPSYSPTSPKYSPTSPSYSPTSPSYSPTSPSYSPTSPSYSPTSPSYSPTSPSYSPTSPSYSPTSPSYSPTSPSYSPTSPSYSPASPSYSPTSPSYSPTSPSYSPSSPSYSPSSPSYSPASPSYSPASPSYSPSSPSYSPSSPSYSPSSPASGPGGSSPSYSPSSSPNPFQ